MDVRTPGTRWWRGVAAAGVVGLALAAGPLAGTGVAHAGDPATGTDPTATATSAPTSSAGDPAPVLVLAPPVPDAPSVEVPTSPAPGEVHVTFTPGNANGATVTGYEVALDGGNGMWTAAPTTDAGGGARLMVLTGLPEGMTLYISVRAATADGPGEKSTPVQPVTVTMSTPGHPQPQAPAVTASSDVPGQVALLVVPGYPNGRAVQGWQVSTDGGATWGAALTAPYEADGVHLALTGQPEGALLHVVVRAVTSDGVGAPSPAQDVRVLSTPTVPGAPTGVAAVARAAQVTVSWSTPAGAAVHHYVATLSPGGGSCTTTALSCVIGATAGVGYTATVVAVSATGVAGPGATVAVPGVVPAPVVPASVPVTTLPLTTDQGVLSQATPGQQITVVGSGYLPGSTVQLVIYSTPVVLGTVVADGQGAFQQAVQVPAGLVAGEHHLVTAGVGTDGLPRYLRMDVTVAAAAPARPGELAWTGFETLPWLVGGTGLVAVGAALLLASRRAGLRSRA